MREEAGNSIPLCIDLDGTLVKSDMLWESLTLLIKRNPFFLFVLPIWLMNGKAFFKREIAKRIIFSVENLPYREELIQYIKAESTKGREIVLATASDSILAQAIADYLGFFTKVLASNGEVNLSGQNKARKLVALYGEQGFEYAGNSMSDMDVWSHAERGVVINGSDNFVSKVKKNVEISQYINVKRSTVDLIWRSLRPHQWVKNLLVFAPLLAAHQVDNSVLFLQEVLAFFAFSLCASSMYILNDLVDLDSDRLHSKKCSRPLASGELSIPLAMVVCAILLLATAILAMTLSGWFQLALVGYVFLTVLYSIILKSRLLIDIFALAALYTLRIFAGGVAIEVILSPWLFAFSIFLFLSLAFIKRCAELLDLHQEGKVAVKGRAYTPFDMNHLATQGVVSGYLASVILALYINSNEVLGLYTHPVFLWFLPPLFLYWIGRIWVITNRGEMHYDPVVFALRDSVSHIILFMFLIVVWIAT